MEPFSKELKVVLLYSIKTVVSHLSTRAILPEYRRDVLTAWNKGSELCTKMTESQCCPSKVSSKLGFNMFKVRGSLH